MSRLNGKVAIVTGGAQGIGRAIALQLARDGAAVAVGDLRKEGADAVAAEIVAAGGQGAAYAVDVSAEAGPAELVAQTVARFGHLDVMVANAGIMQVKPLLELTAGDWDAMFAVNVRGVFLSFQAAARQMIAQGQGGRLLATASIAAKMGSPFQCHYQASKAAVVGMVRSVAWELGSHGITVNCYCPGVVDTAMWEYIDRERGRLLGRQPGDLFKEMAQRSPLGRTEVPEDVAPLVSFLASEESRFITGQAINVCGGMVMW
ncbi:MAG TPA: glucose 1-dehydrogenase [Chloroflexota bacterium]|jgi:meso-butanediol dehydrogenase/(S,S)-butanediol dehydrogenase/diacetyl reductase|nr:glucose 1-dehydrogenase [Chloroflexota bacterium]